MAKVDKNLDYNIGEIDSDSNNKAPNSIIKDSEISDCEEDLRMIRDVIQMYYNAAITRKITYFACSCVELGNCVEPAGAHNVSPSCWCPAPTNSIT